MPLALLQTLHLTGPGQVSPGYGCYTFDAQRNIFYVVYNNFDAVDGIQIDAVNCNGTLRVIRSARYPAYSQGTLMKYHPGQNALFLITQSSDGSEGYLTKIDAASLADLGSARYDNQIDAIASPYRYYTGAAALYIGGNRYYLAISTQTDPVFDCTDFDILGGNGGNKVQQVIHEFDISGSPSWTQQWAQSIQKNICCMEVNEQTNVMFAGTYSNPSKLQRISVPGMGVLETHTFPLDNYFPRISSLALNPDLGYGFCQNEGEQPSPSRIARFSLGNIGLNAINYIDLPTWSATTGNMPQSHLCGNINTANATATQVYFPVLPGETGYNYQVVQANANPFQITDIVNLGSWDAYYLPNVLFDGSRYFGYCARWGSTDILQIGIPRLSGNFHVRHDTGLNNTSKSLKHDAVLNGRTTTTGIGMRRKWLLSSAGFAAVQARSGQNAVEVLGVGDPEIRVTQNAVEVFGTSDPDIRTTQNAVEVLGTSNPDIRITQTAVEVFGSAIPSIRATQIAVEVLAPVSEPPPPEPGFGYGHNFAFHAFHDTGPTSNSIPHDLPLNQWTTTKGIGMRRKVYAAFEPPEPPEPPPPFTYSTIRTCNC